MSEWAETLLGDVTRQVRDAVKVTDGADYKLLGVRWYAQGAFHRETVTSETSKASTLYKVSPGQFIYNRLFAWKGSFGLVTSDFAGCYVSNEFPLFECDAQRVLPEFLALYFGRQPLWDEIERVSTGTTASRNRWKESAFNAFAIPLPPMSEQRRIVAVMSAVDEQIEALTTESATARQYLRQLRDCFINDAANDRVDADRAFSIILGRQRTPSRHTGPNMAPYLRSANIGDGVLHLADVKHMDFTPEEQQKYALAYGDVLVSEGSASENAVGMAAVWRSELPGVICLQKTLLRYRAISGVSIPGYVNHWCKWAYQSGAFRDIAIGSNILHIGSARAESMQVALPDLDTQARIVELLDAVEQVGEARAAELAALRGVRADLLTALLSQQVTVDEAVDQFVDAEVA